MIVPLLAQAAVAGGGVVEVVGQGMDVAGGAEVEVGLAVAERGRVLAEWFGEFQDAVMHASPSLEGVFEARSVGVGVAGDCEGFGKEGLRGLAPAHVGRQAGERELVPAG